MSEERVLFRIWLYREKRKWAGVVDIMRNRGFWMDANEALVTEDDYRVLRLRPRNRGKDISATWFPIIETSLLAPVSTKAIKPWFGHVFGSGKLCWVTDLKTATKELVLSELEIISPARYAEVAQMLAPRKEGFPGDYSMYREVFLCHSSRDKRFVKKLADELSENGIHVWVDYEAIIPGQDFVKRMEEGIAECDFVAVVLTPNFVKGPWAQRELRMAIEREVAEKRDAVIPLLKKDCDIPGMLKTKSYVDFRGSRFDSGLRSLIDGVNRLPAAED